MTALLPMLELTDVILEVGGKGLLECMQCGTCTGVCPWPPLKKFSPREIIRMVSLGFEGYEQEDLWNCVTCNTCGIRCPRGIDLIDVFRATRAVMLESGTAPETYRGPLASLRSDGNPWSGERDQRYKWAKDLNLPQFGSENEFLFFTCCTQAYDPRNRLVGKTLIGLLRNSGINFGILGEEENCCGDQARKMGAESLYVQLRDSNISLFKKNSVKKIIVSSPHCLQAFNKEYSLDLPIQTFHYTQVLAPLIDQGKLVPQHPVELKVTYHDPCYLGRHAGEYEAPRKILSSIPGLELVEMPRNRKTSLCCGGGGGGLWMDVPQEQRFAVLRVKEAQSVGANVIATACPYCTSMLEDAVKVLDLEDEIAIKDVAELLGQSIQETGR
ncbi:MAG: (Fe-S)-binding protein [Pseudomonadota bacterium]